MGYLDLHLRFYSVHKSERPMSCYLGWVQGLGSGLLCRSWLQLLPGLIYHWVTSSSPKMASPCFFSSSLPSSTPTIYWSAWSGVRSHCTGTILALLCQHTTVHWPSLLQCNHKHNTFMALGASLLVDSSVS